MSGSVNQATNLYVKAKQHYTGSSGFMQAEPFNVYVEQLFAVLYRNKQQPYERDLLHSAFTNTLKDWVVKSVDYDHQAFTKAVRDRMYTGPSRHYTVFFGISVKLRNAPFPFKRSLTIAGVKFQVTTQEHVKNIGNGKYVELLTEDYMKLRYDKSHARAELANYVFIKSVVEARSTNAAVNKVSWAFELFTASATIAQEKNRRVAHFGYAGIKSRKPILNPYLFYVDDSAKQPDINVYTEYDIGLQRPEEALTFTVNPLRVAAHKKYLKIVTRPTLSLIEYRIHTLLLEFDRAMGTSDPHTRMLSLWRCLEIATRQSDGNSRKERDIIKIIATYYDGNDAWRQQGELILAFRNAFVHQGESFLLDNRDRYLTWMQDYVATATTLLMWAYDHGIGRSKLTELDDFFDAYPKSLDSLGVSLKLLNARKKQVK